jgi:hypothetical protein
VPICQEILELGELKANPINFSNVVLLLSKVRILWVRPHKTKGKEKKKITKDFMIPVDSNLRRIGKWSLIKGLMRQQMKMVSNVYRKCSIHDASPLWLVTCYGLQWRFPIETRRGGCLPEDFHFLHLLYIHILKSLYVRIYSI